MSERTVHITKGYLDERDNQHLTVRLVLEDCTPREVAELAGWMFDNFRDSTALLLEQELRDHGYDMEDAWL